MKLTVLQSDFAKALSTSSRFVNQRAQLPILGNVVMRASKSRLAILATNLEMSVAMSIGAKVEAEGEIAIPAKNITEIVSNIAEESLSLTAEKEILTVKTSSFDADITGMNTADFPDIPQEIGKGAINISKKVFDDALAKVVFAASMDETRPVLTGVLFLFEEKFLRMVATDGFRLSQTKIAVKGNAKKGKVIIPKSVLLEVQRVAGDNIDLLVKEGESQVVFAAGKTVLSSGILGGDFPNFERIIPGEAKIILETDKQEMIRAVKLASIFARDAANVVRLNISKKGIEVAAESARTGKQKKEVDAKVDGGEISIAFNYRYLEEFLGSLKGDSVMIEMTEPMAAAVFRDTSDKNYIHIIMPVRVQG